jgi:hypothetical protein
MKVIHKACLKPPISNGRAKEYSTLSNEKYKHCQLLEEKPDQHFNTLINTKIKQRATVNFGASGSLLM